jgi:Putative MetA-pathway of phenol degradation
MAWRIWQRGRWFVAVLVSSLAWRGSCALLGAVVILVMLVVGTAQVSTAHPPPGGRMKAIRSAGGSQRSSTCPSRPAPSLSGQKARKLLPPNASDCSQATTTSSRLLRSQKTRISPTPGSDMHSSPHPAMASSGSFTRLVAAPPDSIPASTVALASLAFPPASALSVELASSSIRSAAVPVDSIPALLAELSSVAPLPAPAASAEAAEDAQKEAEETRRAMEVFLREQLVLSRRGELSLEFDTFYSTSTRDEFVRSDGGVALIKRTNRTVSTTFIPRYGIIDGLELDLAIPFGYAEEELDFGVGRSRTDDFGLGDIAGRLRYQLWSEVGARPALILDLEGKSRTRSARLLGTDHWNVGGGVTLVKTLDPVVFFGRLGYTATLERKGRDPGDEIRYEAGMGFSLNDRVSFKMQVVGAAVGRAEVNGQEIAGSSLDIISLLFAVTTRATRNLFVEPVVSIGLTDDTPDVVAGFDLVYQFWGLR